MQVTFTNTTSDPIYISSLYLSLDAGKSVKTRRTPWDLDRDQSLKALIASGDITIAFETEVGDSVPLGPGNPPVSYDNESRPTADAVPTFTSIWNTDDNSPNFSDGVDWRDADGNLT